MERVRRRKRNNDPRPCYVLAQELRSPPAAGAIFREDIVNFVWDLDLIDAQVNKTKLINVRALTQATRDVIPALFFWRGAPACFPFLRSPAAAAFSCLTAASDNLKRDEGRRQGSHPDPWRARGAGAGRGPEGAYTRMIQNINIARVSLITHGSLSALRTLDGVYIPRDPGGSS